MEKKIEELVKNDSGLLKIVSDPEALKSNIMKVQEYLVEARGCDPAAVRQYLEQAIGISKDNDVSAAEDSNVSNQETLPVADEENSSVNTNQENSGDTGRDEVQEVTQAEESEKSPEDSVEEKQEPQTEEVQHEENNIKNIDTSNAEVQMFNVVRDNNEAGYSNNNQWNGNAQQMGNNVQQVSGVNQSLSANPQFSQNIQQINNPQMQRMNPQGANNYQQQPNQFGGQPVGQRMGQPAVNNGFAQNNPVQFNNQGFAQNQVQFGVQAGGTQAVNQVQNQVQPINNNAVPNAQQGFMQAGQGVNNTSLVQPKKENFITKILNIVNKIFKKKSQ